MQVKLESIIPFDNLIKETEDVLKLIEKNGMVVLLKNNQPQYIIQKYENSMDVEIQGEHVHRQKMPLHKAMREVLSTATDRTMHAADLADQIFDRGLYYKKDGCKAGYNQIRARCGLEQYRNIFEALPGNKIRLKEKNAASVVSGEA